MDTAFAFTAWKNAWVQYVEGDVIRFENVLSNIGNAYMSCNRILLCQSKLAKVGIMCAFIHSFTISPQRFLLMFGYQGIRKKG